VATKQSLSDRYTPDFIAQAEERRQKLDYKSLHVGGGSTTRIERVRTLLYQTHQNYYFGHFNASCILAGVLFEQCLICLLEEEIELKGKITCKQDKNIVIVDDPQGLLNQSLYALIQTALHYKIIPNEQAELADGLRRIRNYLMHDDLGSFMIDGLNFEFRFGSMQNGAFVEEHVISMLTSEVKTHCLTRDPQEIWAYYILTRTRRLIVLMFEERVKRLPPEKVNS